MKFHSKESEEVKVNHRPIIVLGSHRAISGQMIIAAMPKARRTIKGADPRMISPMLTSQILLITKRLSPTGGVMLAISMFIVANIPNQMGSSPSFFTAG